jgi:hypothetical protein
VKRLTAYSMLIEFMVKHAIAKANDYYCIEYTDCLLLYVLFFVSIFSFKINNNSKVAIILESVFVYIPRIFL